MFDVNEGSSGVYTATLVDENGDAVAGSALQTATLSLIDRASDSIINDRDAQDILNANDVTISEAGVLTWAFTADDMPIVNARKQHETHLAIFVCTWDDVKQMTHDVEIRVRNLATVTV